MTQPEIYECGRCRLQLSTDASERQWHWDNYDVSVRWPWMVAGTCNYGAIRCIRCMNDENSVPNQGPSRRPNPITREELQAKPDNTYIRYSKAQAERAMERKGKGKGMGDRRN